MSALPFYSPASCRIFITTLTICHICHFASEVPSTPRFCPHNYLLGMQYKPTGQLTVLLKAWIVFSFHYHTHSHALCYAQILPPPQTCAFSCKHTVIISVPGDTCWAPSLFLGPQCCLLYWPGENWHRWSSRICRW